LDYVTQDRLDGLLVADQIVIDDEDNPDASAVIRPAADFEKF
jgi:hypothetical protein